MYTRIVRAYVATCGYDIRDCDKALIIQKFTLRRHAGFANQPCDVSSSYRTDPPQGHFQVVDEVAG